MFLMFKNKINNEKYYRFSETLCVVLMTQKRLLNYILNLKCSKIRQLTNALSTSTCCKMIIF